jgi:hypothetical protein
MALQRAAARRFLAVFYKQADRIFVRGGIEAMRALRQGELEPASSCVRREGPASPSKTGGRRFAMLVVGARGESGTLGWQAERRLGG